MYSTSVCLEHGQSGQMKKVRASMLTTRRYLSARGRGQDNRDRANRSRINQCAKLYINVIH